MGAGPASLFGGFGRQWPALNDGGAAAPVVAALQSGGAGYSGFSPRESELLKLVGTGAGNLAMSAELGLITKTVQNNVSLLMTTLGVNSRALLVVAARDLANLQGG